MSWYAVDAVEEALEDTRQLLLPFDLGTWLRLAVIVIFTGGGTGAMNPASFIPSGPGGHDPASDSGTGSYSDFSSTDTAFETGGNAITGLATSSSSLSNTVWVVLGLFLFGVLTALLYLSSVFEFIYYQSLLERDVRIRRNFKRHWFNALRYFGFKVVYISVLLSFVAAVILGFIVNPFIGVFGVVLSIPCFIVLGVFAGLVHDFVLPEMIQEKQSLIQGWRSIWPSLQEQWREVVVYLLVKLGLGIGIGIAVSTAAIFLLVPFILVFGAFGLLFSALAEILAVVPIFIGIAAFAATLIGVTVATRTFIYFYILRVYHSISS